MQSSLAGELADLSCLVTAQTAQMQILKEMQAADMRLKLWPTRKQPCSKSQCAHPDWFAHHYQQTYYRLL
eukprot:5658814-Amphidinium_carterae.1